MHTKQKPFWITLSLLSFATPVVVYASAYDLMTPNNKDMTAVAQLAALDEAEVAAATEAKRRELSPSVDQYASLMKREHAKNLMEIRRLGPSFSDPAYGTLGANQARQQAAADLAELSKLQGREFERGYMDAMVKGHEDALKMIDDKLPLLQGANTKRLFSDTRKHVEMHLADARRVRSQL